MPKSPEFLFRLYVAGEAQNSLQAISNLNSLCKSYLLGRHSIEVVDVFRQPKRALADGILMTPTLLRLSPSPQKRVIGSLSQTSVILLALGLEPVA